MVPDLTPPSSLPVRSPELSLHGHEDTMLRDPTLPEIIRRNAQQHPDLIAIRYLSRKGDVRSEWSYEALADRMDRLARSLSSKFEPDARVLVMGPDSQAFALAVLAAMAANLIPVAVATPSSKAMTANIDRIARDCSAAAVVGAGMHGHARFAGEAGTHLSSLPWIDALAENKSEPDGLGKSETDDRPSSGIALLQYTSGSTRAPRGVVITHSQLHACLDQTLKKLSISGPNGFVGWLPLYHDMGLIGLTFQPLFNCQSLTLLPPRAFLADPMVWMRAISTYRATHTVAPNFAYDLCARAVQPDADLDLSCLRMAIDGAEPVRFETLRRFNSAFAEYSLDPTALTPAFGMAESTLAVTMDPQGSQQRVTNGPSGERRVVACGTPMADLTVVIVDRDTGAPKEDGVEGEIWVAGPSISTWYWNDTEATAAVFEAALPDGRGPFLRTGDLGFVEDGQLYVAGRLSDIIIVHGRNIHPHDIEATIADAHPSLGTIGAAVGVEDRNSTEGVSAIHEVEAAADAGSIATASQAARKAVLQEHGIALVDLVLVERGAIPRTTSGKVRRSACLAMLQGGEFEARQVFPRLRASAPHAATRPANRIEEEQSLNDVLTWMRAFAADRLDFAAMDDRRTLSPDVAIEFGRRGVMGLQAPPTHGGLGLDNEQTARVFVQLGAIDLSLATLVGIQNVLCLSVLMEYLQPALKASVLPDLASGRQFVAFAFSEPQAGSDFQGLSTTASPMADGCWRIEGRKMWVGSAALATYAIVFARTNASEITAFLVPTGAPGFQVGQEAPTLGLRATMQSEITLSGVVVGPEAVLGRTGDGNAVARLAMARGRMAIAASAAGAMRRCAEIMVRYAQRRVVAGRPLMTRPILRRWVGDALAGADASEAMARMIAHRLDAGHAVPDEIAIAAKVAASEQLWRVADRCVQLLGARGYSENNVAARMLRDARALRIYEGPTEALVSHLGLRVNGEAGLVTGWLDNVAEAGHWGEALSAALETVSARYDGSLLGVRDQASGELAVAALTAATAPPGAGAWARRLWEGTLHRWCSPTLQFESVDSAETLLEQVDEIVGSLGDITCSAGRGTENLDDLLRPRGYSAETATLNAETLDSLPGPSIIDDDAREIKLLLTQWLAENAEYHARAAHAPLSMVELGIDSLKGLALTSSLGDRLGREIPLNLIWQAQSIPHAARLIADLPVSSLRSSQDLSGEQQGESDEWETVRI